MPIFMQIPGVEGDAGAGGHEKWIALDSCSFGVGRSITLTKGTTGQREASAASISEITVSKSLCSGSPKLFEAALSGTGKDVVIEYCKTDTTNPYLVLTLTNTLLSNYHQSATGDAYPTETVNLNFTKIEYKHIPMVDENTPGTPVAVPWDLTKAAKP